MLLDIHRGAHFKRIDTYVHDNNYLDTLQGKSEKKPSVAVRFCRLALTEGHEGWLGVAPSRTPS
jgi:hypothetical protein